MTDARLLLTRLRAENVRSFARLDLELGPLTVLVGPNGAGKSNVVTMLRLLREVATRDAKYPFAEQGGVGSVLRLGESDLCIDAEVSSKEVSVLLSVSKSSKFHFRSEWNVLRGTMDTAVAKTAENGIEWEVVGLEFYGIQLLHYLVVCQPEPIPLRDLTQRAATDRSLREDFSNLGAVLLIIRETPYGDEIDRALALLVDGATGYRVLQAGSTLVPQILYGAADARDLGIESDGTIRLVALLAAMYQPVPPSILVLEEPELGLHPGVLSALAGFISEASTRMQVLVTTHSPDLIDAFDLDTIRVVEKIDGESRIGPVRPQQREAVRKHLFTPSEIMRMEGLQLDVG